jgi:undecaprenyl-diphosphatase
LHTAPDHLQYSFRLVPYLCFASTFKPVKPMLKYLQTLDEKSFLFLNGKHNAFFDVIMYWASNQFVWIPLYITLFIFLLHRYKKAAWYILICVGLMITASDQLSSGLIKNLVERPRPSHAVSLAGQVHLSDAGPGGEYGFVSSHAANTFALVIFLSLVLPREQRPLKYLLTGWAMLVSYSRIYNGVHYPGDVLGGILLGALLAFLFRKLFNHFLGYYLIRIKSD